MQKLSKLFFFLSFLFLLFTSPYSLIPVSAQEAFPKIGFPCTDVNDPEFHPLRPYQAAPCGDANKALYCSNELKFIESFDLTSKCPIGDNTSDFDCNPNFNVDKHNLYIELKDSMFPIMGNTEDEFDHATKVNEYASWYLSGVNNRAKYGENAEERVVNFSGPVQKLLPKLIQEAERIETIKNASTDVPSDDEETSEVEDPAPANHNQLVVCGNVFKPFGLIEIGQITPTPCYNVNVKHRLLDWQEGDLSLFNTVFRRTAWNKKIPPLPWANEKGEPFESQEAYTKAYREWKGDFCAKIPFIDLNFCIDNPFVPNKWADLYQYIPLSSTTDKKGMETILDVQFKPSSGTEIANEKYNEAGKKSAPLYFAHTQEVKELSELLNKTYTPSKYESEKLPETTEKNVCSAVNVRVNKGDNLFPGDRIEGDTKEIVIPGVTYNITQVLCKVTETTKERFVPYPPPGRWITEIVYAHGCNAEITIVVPTNVKVPSADEIFSTTVADSGSTFRKIFPKVEKGAPVSCIADIPTVTSVTYNANESDVPKGGSLEFKVKKYPEDGAGSDPELTFPHIGSVYEYFLKGIQTALRPKGYGEPITSGDCKPIIAQCGEWESKLEVSSGGDCGVCTSGLGNLAKKILATAGKKYNVPAASIWAAMQHEGGDWDEFRNQFTDENVRKWSTPIECGGEPMPRCDPNDKTSSKSYPPFGFLPYWFYRGEGDGSPWAAVKEFDPTRNSINTVSHCNFLDATFASAKSLATWSAFARTPTSCYKQDLSSSVRPTSCNSSAWTDAKVVQSHIGYWIGITPWCPDGTGGPSPLANNIPIPYYASMVLSDFKSAKCN